MTQFFARKLNKKGFTLAELLIVIAIIAVLIAIALPIFTGALEKARYGVHHSNGRSLKSMAVTEILTNPALLGGYSITDKTQWTVKGSYTYDTEQFDITEIKVSEAADDPEPKMSATTDSTYADDVIELDGSQKAVKTVGRIPTSGKDAVVYYLIVITGNEISTEYAT